MNRTRCGGTNAKGRPCQSPLVGEDGFCRAHVPGGEACWKRLAQKGSMKSSMPKGLDASVLGPLETYDDANRWIAEIGRAVVGKRLPASEARAGIQATEAWLKAHGDAVTPRPWWIHSRVRSLPGGSWPEGGACNVTGPFVPAANAWLRFESLDRSFC